MALAFASPHPDPHHHKYKHQYQHQHQHQHRYSHHRLLLSPLLLPHLQPPPSDSKTLTLLLRSSNPPRPIVRMQDSPPRHATPRIKKSKHGTSRRSILKKTFKQEQVTFSVPVSDHPTVGIIGGGMAGLISALYLDKKGIKSTVFDTGMHGLGGRMGTRIVEPHRLIFDHAAQFFTVTDPRFSQLVNGWIAKGLVKQWQGVLGQLQPGGHFLPLPSSPPRYIAVSGMRSLADSLLSETCLVEIIRPCWISALEPFNGMWHLSENEKPRGKFDAIIIAHNGKCANRLLASSGLPLIAKQMKRLELSSIWALLCAFEDPLPFQENYLECPFEGAFVKGIDALSWMGNNSKKLSSAQNNNPHCWTFFSTSAFAKRNKVPQENIPNTTAEKVKASMLEGVETALGLTKGSLKQPFYTRLQLWGAALPTNSPGTPCIFDPLARAGICGDWLLGSSLEAAAISGMAMANHVADYIESGGRNPDGFSVGLDNDFSPVHGHDIGQFPGLDTEDHMQKSPETEDGLEASHMNLEGWMG